MGKPNQTGFNSGKIQLIPLPSDNTRVQRPAERVEPIGLTDEQKDNLRRYGSITRPFNATPPHQLSQARTGESTEAKVSAQARIEAREKLAKFAAQKAKDKELEMKVLPYAIGGAAAAATGTLPIFIGAELAGRAVDSASESLTGRSWGENVLPEYPMVGALTNPGYLIGGKSGQIQSRVSRNLEKNNLRKLIYNNIHPVGYSGKSAQFKALGMDILTNKNPTLNTGARQEVASELHNMAIAYKLPSDEILRNRNEAWRKYLQLEQPGDNLYLPNRDGSFRYNKDRLSDGAEHLFLNQDNYYGKSFDAGVDLLTSNGGNVGRIKVYSSNMPDVSYARMIDDFDLHPMRDPSHHIFTELPIIDNMLTKWDKNGERVYRNWVPKKLIDFEAGSALGVGKPFRVDHRIPFRSTPEINPATRKPTTTRHKYNSENILYMKESLADDAKSFLNMLDDQDYASFTIPSTGTTNNLRLNK